MRPETLLAKFDLRGLNYEQMSKGGGKGTFSLEEQLAIVGVSWKESPVGFLVLFVEVLANKASLKLLQQAVKLELAALTSETRGQKSERAFEAMVAAAIIEATQPLGVICTSCGGTGKYKNASYNLRKCQHCDDGRVAWSVETRFATMCSTGFACTYSYFKKHYHPLLELLTKWLADKRNAAMLALMERIRAEEMMV
ncbi:hypothetical protein AL546_010000 [Vibrio vulnificus]|uniref:hypothetical protein n=1 Tax=Vibrio vulnificus TaxID=672 RepID=UPI00073598B8|nr:hypothetical protein [Vibrio vulnificus]PNM58921.1 hypothetical protein AL546_010000 [Vibrio vulnificus]SUP13833.1 uncharacterized phage protein [Vibrio vulnificus]